MGGEQNYNVVPTMVPKYPQHASKPVGKQIHGIMRDRLRQFTDQGQYRENGLWAKMYDGRLSGDPNVKLWVWDAPDLTRPTFEEATKKSNNYRKTHKGEAFGPSWSTHWFRVQFTIPSDWSYKAQVELHWDTNSEGMVWTEDGKPLQGLTGGGERVEWVIPLSYRTPDKEYTIYIEMACNGMFGNPDGNTIQPPNPNRYFTLTEADLVSVNTDARALFYDFWIIGDAAREFPDDSWQEHQALQVCNDIMDTFIAGNGSRSAIFDCRVIAKRYLGNDIDTEKVYDNQHSSSAIVNAIGNCHIDTCWLWPWAETKRKIARSWSSQCDLLDRYPEHRFVASQAQQFKWLEKLYPYAFDRVKDHVKKGTFMPIGGSWVEHDTNMPSGESLVRQFVYGQRYFESRFGQRCRTFWLPDTFGYSTQLPQLCRLAGMEYFFTQKLSWNNINNFPHTTFNWVSLDGSQVICHMAPCETYTAEAHFGDVHRSVSQHKSLDQDNTSLLPFGKGDGGGGPTVGQLEKLRRCRGLTDTVGPLLPRVKICNNVDKFFDDLKLKQVRGDTDLVTWYGELYFELHRGTYTTQANNKRNNRAAETMLHNIEYLATKATIKDTSYKYPKKELDEMWEDVLLCQFHDCLPGSCIEMCYDDSDELYAKVFKIGEKCLKDAMHALGFNNDSAASAAQIPVNTLSWDRGETQPWAEAGEVALKTVGEDAYVINNDDLKIKVEGGVITSLYDIKAAREILPKGGKANQLVLFDDKPLFWQAWDVEVFHLRSRQELQASSKSRVVENTSKKVSIETTTKISDKSSITCGDHSWSAHKSIICAQSKHFMKVFNSPYVEANTSKHKVDGEDPEVFEALLRYLYTRSYDISEAKETSPIQYHTRVHNLAFRYEVPQLAARTVEVIHTIASAGRSDEDLAAAVLELYEHGSAKSQLRAYFRDLIVGNAVLLIGGPAGGKGAIANMLKRVPDLAVDVACHLAATNLERGTFQLDAAEARYRCPGGCSNPRACVLPIDQVSVDENTAYPCYYCHRKYKTQEWLKGKVEGCADDAVERQSSSR